MKNIFTFTISTPKEIRFAGDGIFGEDGAPVGRILHRSKVSIDEGKTLYTYDVESTPEIFEKLNSGYKLYKIEDYSIQNSSVFYTRDN